MVTMYLCVTCVLRWMYVDVLKTKRRKIEKAKERKRKRCKVKEKKERERKRDKENYINMKNVYIYKYISKRD